MTKVRKVKRRKRFRVNVNRKRLRNRLQKLPTIECEVIKNEWEPKHSTVKNLKAMGLAFNPNQVLTVPSVKATVLSNSQDQYSNSEKKVGIKRHVVESLEADAKYPRKKMFQLPNSEVQFVTYMMDKYKDDYKAMVRDRKNYNQLTWRQIKAKIDTFKKIPEQYAEYLVKTGEIHLDDVATPLKKLKPDFERPAITKNPKSKKCKSKKKSIIKSIWEEETILDEEPDTKNQSNLEVNVEESSQGNLKSTVPAKLQLFQDNENDAEIEDILVDNESENDDNSGCGSESELNMEVETVRTLNPKRKSANSKSKIKQR